MEAIKFLKFGLIISLILFISSCNNKDETFYYKIRANTNCMVVCTVQFNNHESIKIVMEKNNIYRLFKQFNHLIDDEIIIMSIKSHKPIEVKESLYQELYGLQIINQQRVDSLLEIGVEQLFIYNHKNERLLNTLALKNETLMEQLYAIKVLFDKKILVEQDCESGYYFEIQ